MRELVARVERSLPPAPALLAWLLLAHVVLKVVLFPFFMNAPTFGDEQAYLNGGMALSNGVRDVFAFTRPDLHELNRNVVGSGWFMPGMSIVVTPLYVVCPEAPMWLVRGYLGLVNLALFIGVVRAVARTLGHRWACVLVAIPGLIPSWIVFTYGAWGDLPAGLVLVLMLLHLLEMFRGLRRGTAPTLREGVVLGLLAIVVLYLRASTLGLLAALGALTLLTAVLLLRGRERRRAVASAVLAGAVFGALLAPWSIAASSVLGARVTTTTTLPTVLATTFGERDQICFGECDPDSTMWFRPLRYAREVGRATDTSEVVVLKQMSDYALRDLGPRHYLDQVLINLGAYLVLPTIFMDHLEPPSERGVVAWAGILPAEVATWLLYLPMMYFGLVSLLFRARRSLEARLVDVLVKLMIGGMLVQPFVHICGGRYWTTAAPFLALGGASLLWERRIAQGVAPAPATGIVTARDETVARWLGRVQVTLNALTAVIVVVLAGAALIWGGQALADLVRS